MASLVELYNAMSKTYTLRQLHYRLKLPQLAQVDLEPEPQTSDLIDLERLQQVCRHRSLSCVYIGKGEVSLKTILHHF